MMGPLDRPYRKKHAFEKRSAAATVATTSRFSKLARIRSLTVRGELCGGAGYNWFARFVRPLVRSGDVAHDFFEVKCRQRAACSILDTDELQDLLDTLFHAPPGRHAASRSRGANGSVMGSEVPTGSPHRGYGVTM